MHRASEIEKPWEKRKYWLFQIMYDWYPKSWNAMLEHGIAAHNWPKKWRDNDPYAKGQYTIFSKLRKGDCIVAAFKGHRFAGYGILTSDLYPDGPSLNIPHRRRKGEIVHFKERFNVDWTVIPLEKNPPFIRCHDLKQKGFNIDLQRGCCVKEIDERTFNALKERLDQAGAKRLVPRIETDSFTLPEEIPETETSGLREGACIKRSVNAYERNPRARQECIAHYGLRCAVCEKTLEEIYGEAGKELIHVHHLRELSEIEEEYEVDPIKDLRPVCPNCHAVIHSRKPAYTIEEVKGFLRKLLE